MSNYYHWPLKISLAVSLFVLILQFLLLPKILYGQKLAFRNYSVREGMSQSQVQDIIQDKMGYLWFATAEGITKFDGREFIHHSKKDGLAGSYVGDICIDYKGDFWLGHRVMGISRYIYDENRFEKVSLPQGYENTHITDILEERPGVLWFTTAAHGLLKYDHSRWITYDKSSGLPTLELFSLCFNQNDLWIGSGQGIVVLSPDHRLGPQFSILPSNTGVSDGKISVLFKDSKNVIWIGDSKAGIVKFTPSSHPANLGTAGTFSRIIRQINRQLISVESIFEDKDHNIWFGTAQNGIMRYSDSSGADDPEKIFLINRDRGFEERSVKSIFQDREGSIWIGTDGNGVYQYRGEAFELYGKNEGMLDDIVWSIIEDRKGGLWFGTEKGLTYFPKTMRSNPRYYNSKNWDGNDMVIDLQQDSRGIIWFCLHGTGVRQFNPITQKFRTINELEKKNIITLEEDVDGNLWFGGFSKGVFKLNQQTGEIQNFRAEDGLGSNTVFKILRAKNGNLWFATNGAGVTKYDGISFSNYSKEQGLLAPSVLSLADDNVGNLWIGSEGDGLFRYDGNSFEDYSQQYGLWKDDIYSLVCDNQNNVWIGTRRGVEKFNIKTKKIKKYGEFEGFSAIETNQNAVYKNEKGQLWFGTIKGAVKFDPEKNIINSVSPLTYINKIRVYLQDAPIPDDGIFSYRDNYLTFNFLGLSFVVPEKIRYSYMLDGLDRDWSPMTDETYATYANLSPGDYVFKVKAKNSDDIWSEPAATYRFSIAAPFWLKGWFYLLMVSVIGLSIYGVHAYRVRNFHRNNIRLEEMVHARTKDLLAEKEKTQRAYEALLESESKLKQVTQSVNAFLWSTGIDDQGQMDYIFITDTFLQISGFDKNDFPRGENKFYQFLKIVHPEDREYLNNALQRILSGHKMHLSYRIITKEGNVRWLYDNPIPIKNKDGKVNLIHGVGIDATDRKLAEEALKKSEEKYETFIRYSTEAIWCLDLNTALSIKNPLEKQIDHILREAYLSDCNDAMAQMYGYKSAREIIGTSVSSGFMWGAPGHEEYLRQFISSNYRLQNAEFYERDENGSLRVILASFIGIIENNNLIRCWGMQQDITERKRAEDALRESEEIYRRLIERSPDAIVVHSDGKIDYINQAGVKLFGAAKKSELIGKKLIDFSHPDYREMGMKRVKQIYEEKKDVRLLEQKMIKLDGTEFDVEVMGAPVIFRGKASGQSIVRDITDRKRMEMELQKAQKLESVGILAGGIAHDFNNILTAILGNISLGKLYTRGEKNAERVLGEAEKATLHAKDLTQQLLTFSKGGAPVKETTSIINVVKDSANFVLSGSNIECNYEYTPDLWAVDVDSSQISQVIQNLIINAEQAMPNGKKINISLENMIWEKDLPPALKPGKYVKITITDDGIGIPQEHINKIFDPYFTTKQKGSGLGLATTYSIIKRHEGHIEIKSQIGKGTRVELYIPASEKKIFKKQFKSTNIEEGKGRILVMDDEEMLRELSKQFLSHLGYDVETVPDGESAIELFQSAIYANIPFSLVIMDLTIPGGLGGKETIIRLKEIDPKVKAIVSSGYSNDPVLANFKKYGFKAVLTKPYKIETLSSIIAAVMNGKKEKLKAG